MDCHAAETLIRYTDRSTPYLVLLPPASPNRLNAPISSKCCISRVAVALDVFAMPTYFRALIPPSNPSGPSSSMRRITFCWRSLSLSRSEEHTSELQSRGHLVCRLLLEEKN